MARTASGNLLEDGRVEARQQLPQDAWLHCLHYLHYFWHLPFFCITYAFLGGYICLTFALTFALLLHYFADGLPRGLRGLARGLAGPQSEP